MNRCIFCGAFAKHRGDALCQVCFETLPPALRTRIVALKEELRLLYLHCCDYLAEQKKADAKAKERVEAGASQ